jgi:NADH:ubiquinone oxidoreductase subunit F (NADH-binding)
MTGPTTTPPGAPRILTRRLGRPNPASLDACLMDDGYGALSRALLAMRPEEVIGEVRASGLRGRGGGGFPVGTKWELAAREPRTPRTLIANADEGEPGSFKDRLLLENDPHALLEGMALAGYAVGAQRGFIYVRGEYGHAARVLERAVAEAAARGFLGPDILNSGFSFTVTVHRGAGAFVCGEETALIESLEGKRGKSRVRPPFPASAGYLGTPTVVNNVETLCNIAPILRGGGAWFAGIGAPGCPGTKLFSVSGHVARPGVYELPMGVTLRELVFGHAGGMAGGQAFLAAFPGGASSACLAADGLDTTLDYDSLAAAGSSLGSGAVIVLGESADMVEAAWVLLRFFSRESCGKCTPCREGLYWMRQVMTRIRAGEGREGDLGLLLDLSASIRGASFCGLGERSCDALASTIEKFPGQWRRALERGTGTAGPAPMERSVFTAAPGVERGGAA